MRICLQHKEHGNNSDSGTGDHAETPAAPSGDGAWNPRSVIQAKGGGSDRSPVKSGSSVVCNVETTYSFFNQTLHILNKYLPLNRLSPCFRQLNNFFSKYSFVKRVFLVTFSSLIKMFLLWVFWEAHLFSFFSFFCFTVFLTGVEIKNYEYCLLDCFLLDCILYDPGRGRISCNEVLSALETGSISNVFIEEEMRGNGSRPWKPCINLLL